MDIFQEAKNLIEQSKNIYILPSLEQEESIVNALALFYTLKELNKNVNLIIDEIPERLKFLIPSLDYISYPKNFIISIPNSLAEISQIRYEKNEKDLKIYMTLDKGNIRKNDISFYFTEPKADLLVTIGLKNFNDKTQQNSLENDILTNAPILNIDSSLFAKGEQIDNSQENKKFGKINLIEERSLAEIINKLIEVKNKEATQCLLTSLVIYTENFKKNLTAEVFQLAADLVKKGGDLKEIVANINPKS